MTVYAHVALFQVVGGDTFVPWGMDGREWINAVDLRADASLPGWCIVFTATTAIDVDDARYSLGALDDFPAAAADVQLEVLTGQEHNQITVRDAICWALTTAAENAEPGTFAPPLEPHVITLADGRRALAQRIQMGSETVERVVAVET